jgi:hypothetical protein
MMASEKARVVIAHNGVVTVHVSAATLYNAEAIQRILPKVLGPLGCPNCHSGRLINWQQEEGQFEAGG